MPPVMGAAAFLMAEYVGITYADVVKHAILPALLTYGALFYVVDLEAVKAGMTGIARTRRRTLAAGPDQGRHHHLVASSSSAAPSIGASAGRATVFGEAASWVAVAFVVVAYVALIANRARYPDLAARRSQQAGRPRCRISTRWRAPASTFCCRSRC